MSRRGAWVRDWSRTLGAQALRWLALAILASIALAVVELAIALFIQLFLKNLGLLSLDVKTAHIPGITELTSTHLALFLVVLALGRAVAFFLVNTSGNVSMEMITARIRRITVWDALLNPTRRTVPAAEVNAHIGDLANRASQFALGGSNLLALSVQAVGLAIVLLVLAAGESIVALIGLGVVGLLILRLNRAVRAVAAKVPPELSALTHGIERIARNLTLVRVLRTEGMEHRRLANSIDTYARHSLRAAFLGNFAATLAPFAGILLIIVLVAFSQGVLHTPAITLLSFLYLFVRFVQTLTTAGVYFSICNAQWPHFAECLGFVRTFDDAALESAMTAGRLHVPPTATAVAGTYAAPSIELRNVEFGYPGANTSVIRGASIKIAAGSQFAIVGPSGCGKSTLLGLILGLYEPTAGTVFVDGQPARAYFEASTTRIGYVGAEPFLIAGTVRDNLRYGLRHDTDDALLWQALEQAQLRRVVEALPTQLGHAIPEDGGGLSAGQKQRLCLARALLARPLVLVLDEVSANLDVDTEHALAESLKTLRGVSTTIVVSHRKEFLKYADETLVLAPTTAPHDPHREPWTESGA